MSNGGQTLFLPRSHGNLVFGTGPGIYLGTWGSLYIPVFLKDLISPHSTGVHEDKSVKVRR